jgi:hypothetical protein
MSGLTCHTAPVRARGIRVERVPLEAQTYRRRRARNARAYVADRGGAVVISCARILTGDGLFRANGIGRGVR